MDWNTTPPPKDGRDIIVWTSSNEGFPDITATIWCSAKIGWLWESTGEEFMGPIHGWIDYPKPHGPRPDEV